MSTASPRIDDPPTNNASTAIDSRELAAIGSNGGGGNDDDGESVSSTTSSHSSSAKSSSDSSSISSSSSSASSRSSYYSGELRSKNHLLECTASDDVRNAELSRQLQVVRQDPPTLLRRRPMLSNNALLGGLRRISSDPARRSSGEETERDRKSRRRKGRSSRVNHEPGSESHQLRRRIRQLENSPRQRQQPHHHHPRRRSSSSSQPCRAGDCCSGISTLLVCTSVFVWLTCVVLERSSAVPAARIAYGRPVPPSAHLRARAAIQPLPQVPPLNQHRPLPLPPPPPPPSSFVQNVWSGVQSMFHSSSQLSSGPTNMMNKKKNVEDLDPGCVHEDWQLSSYPSCNEVHSIDLGEVVREWKRRVREQLHPTTNRTQLRTSSTTETHSNDTTVTVSSNRYPFGYLSDAGLWRTVWAVRDNAARSSQEDDWAPPIVLKLMKQEHEVDARNLDRHRREAVVMERLTSSPYVASMYGHCGTTVMTEFLGATLHTLIKAEDDEPTRLRWGFLDNSTYLSPSTPQGRLQMALHAARGLEALHENSIVHADVQDQQFLLSTTVGAGGKPPRLVLNDFNRCRFLARKVVRNGTANATTAAATTACPFRIPTAPGSSRSPEEYAYEELTEQIDVFSLANVLHQILTGQDPWEGWSALEISRQVQRGVKPMSPPELLVHPSDKVLQNLTLRAYELDPAIRIRASELVQELEAAMATFFEPA
jgi:Protein tyrosine and serine/threonine kinase